MKAHRAIPRATAPTVPTAATAATAAILAVAAAALAASPAAAQFTFAAEPTYADCSELHYPTRARLFDMDGDGRRDLLVPGRDRANVLNWMPLGDDAVFGAVRLVEVAGQVDDVVAADVDGDGAAELVAAIRSYPGRIQVLRRGPGGTMVADPPVAIDREPRSIVAGDFDGDGDADIAASCYGSEQVTVLRNDGTGAFAVAQRVRVDPWAGGIPGPQDIKSADLDGDGRHDLVVGNIGTRRFQVLRGRGGCAFHPAVSWLAPDFPGITGAAVVGFDVGDLDGDGDVDILAPLLNSGSTQPLVAFLNDGSGGFAQRVLAGTVSSTALAQVGYHWTASLADFDGDGRLDAVSSTALPGAIILWRNTGSGSTVSFQPVGRLDYSSFARDLLCANVDGDCDPDVIVADIAGHYVLGYLNLRACLGGSADAPGVPPALPWSHAVLPAAFAGSATDIARHLADDGPSPGGGPARPAAAFTASACSATGESGPCDQVHAAPGCHTTPCCEAVCSVVPDCCDVTWDQLCVDLVRDECDGPPCPSFGACDTVHDDPGCNDPDCCLRVTDLDGVCEGATWDWVCAERAIALCGLPPCTVTVPAGAIDEGEPCYEHLNDGATRAGEMQSIACGQVFAGTCTTGAPRDTDWYSLGSEGERRITVTVDAEFPLEVHLMRGPTSGPLEAVETFHGGRCAPVLIDRCIQGGPWSVVVTLGQSMGPLRSGQPCTEIDPDNPPGPDDPLPEPGFDGVRYWLSLGCGGCGAPGDLDGDGRVSGSDLGLLLGAWGQRGPADLNGDGAVTGSDLGLLLGAWTGP
jgi:hypothetical protein